MIERLNAWCDAHLVPEWRAALKLASVKLALVVGAVSGVAVQCWPYIVQALPYLPPSLRPIAAAASCIAIVLGAAGTRLWKQNG